MAYQFVHVESYARSSSGKKPCAGSVIAEAEREPQACPHVTQPQPPIVVRGKRASEFYSDVCADADTAKDPRGRKLRKDAHVLVAGVASYPVPCAELNPDDPAFKKWQTDTLDWFEQAHGVKIGSAVLHLDEGFPHLHMYAAPDFSAGQRIADVHPGEAAKQAAEGKKTAKERAFSEAMRKYQDSYFNEVASNHGQARTGPKRRRMSRAEWLAEQHNLKLLAEKQAKADKRDSAFAAQLAQQQAKINDQKAELAAARAALGLERKALDSERKAMEKERDALTKERDDLAKLRRSLVVKETTLQQKATEIEDRFTSAKQQLNNRKLALDKTDKVQVLAENKKLRTELVSVKLQLQKINSINDRTADLTAKLDVLTSKYATVCTSLSSYDERFDQLKDALDDQDYDRINAIINGNSGARITN